MDFTFNKRKRIKAVPNLAFAVQRENEKLLEAFQEQSTSCTLNKKTQGSSIAKRPINQADILENNLEPSISKRKLDNSKDISTATSNHAWIPENLAKNDSKPEDNEKILKIEEANKIAKQCLKNIVSEARTKSVSDTAYEGILVQKPSVINNESMSFTNNEKNKNFAAQELIPKNGYSNAQQSDHLYAKTYKPPTELTNFLSKDGPNKVLGNSTYIPKSNDNGVGNSGIEVLSTSHCATTSASCAEISNSEPFKQVRKLSDVALKLKEAKRTVHLKLQEDGQPDPKKMTLFDLIAYNPKTNPMHNKIETENSNGKETDVSQPGTSSEVKTPRKRKYTPRRRWTEEETDLFYLTLNCLGLDFTAMEQVIPNRNRRQIHLKFKREDRINSKRIDEALNSAPKYKSIEEIKEYLRLKERLEKFADKIIVPTEQLSKSDLKFLNRSTKRSSKTV